MRIANLDGRAVLIVGADGAERAVDIATASRGRFGPDPAAVYDRWDELLTWSAGATGPDADGPGASGPGASRPGASGPGDDPGTVVDPARLGAPSPAPRQVFAVGLNYDAHAAESGFESPTHLPPVFTKYVSSFSGPVSTVVIPEGGNVDWEVELVVVIGRTAGDLADGAGWDHVAGVTVGQDLSERVSQLRGPAPQFGLGKSFPGFSPQGPWLVTPDELADRDDLEIGCSVGGEELQKGRTRDLIFPVGKLVETLSRNVTLYPGDVLFTGTPAGVGAGRTPPRFLRQGEELVSRISGIGELRQRFVAAEDGPR